MRLYVKDDADSGEALTALHVLCYDLEHSGDYMTVNSSWPPGHYFKITKDGKIVHLDEAVMGDTRKEFNNYFRVEDTTEYEFNFKLRSHVTPIAGLTELDKADLGNSDLKLTYQRTDFGYRVVVESTGPPVEYDDIAAIFGKKFEILAASEI